jgi:hypothetical protein
VAMPSLTGPMICVHSLLVAQRPLFGPFGRAFGDLKHRQLIKIMRTISKPWCCRTDKSTEAANGIAVGANDEN